MIIQSIALGELDIEDSQLIEFSNGMPGFEGLKHFALVQPDPALPFSYLQSADQAEVSFLLADPFRFYGDYELELSDHVQDDLGIQEERDVQVWSIVTLRDDIRQSTINLLAPVIINVRKNAGRQIILQGASYHTKHPLVPASTGAETGV